MRPVILGDTHGHVDGGKPVLDCLDDLHRLSGISPELALTPDQIRARFADAHVNIREKFETVTSLLQTSESLALMGLTYGRSRAREGFVRIEAKFAPWFHTDGGLTPRAATEHMIRGFRQAERETGIEIVPVLCINRDATPEEGIAIARIALDYDGEVILDLACDEAEHPPEKHLPAYALTFGSNVIRSAHAGEWVAREPAATYRARLLENVRTAVRVLRCHDVGHAIPLPDDPELVREVVDKGIRISGCPLSNLSLGLIKDVRDLRIAELLDAGVRYTLNADDDLFLPPMPEVVAACDQAYGFTASQCRALEANCL